MPRCSNCGESLNIIGNQVGRRDVCPVCDFELHACKQCRHFDENAAKSCKEPFAEVPLDKESANFCELFQLGEVKFSSKNETQQLLETAESLFKKK